MLRTAQIYVQAGEHQLGLSEMMRAYSMLISMRQTRKAKLLRAHVVQCMERIRVCSR